MHLQDPTGAASREPTAKKVHKAQLVAIGPHHEWSADGHNKMSALGFPIWGIHFLRSIHNITIERGWAQLRIKWVDNMKAFWEGGASLYHPEILRE